MYVSILTKCYASVGAEDLFSGAVLVPFESFGRSLPFCNSAFEGKGGKTVAKEECILANASYAVGDIYARI